MSHKSKGCNAERELIHLFWSTDTWSACRVAGSGSMKYPAPDVIAATANKLLAIECKACKGAYQYLTSDEVRDLLLFSKKTGAQPLIAVRFNNEPWYFVPPLLLKETKTQYVVTREDAPKIGKLFKDLIDSK